MTNQITVYGIHNCDTVKKARRWLDEQQLHYIFHDFRKDGLNIARVGEFEAALGWQKLVNKRSTTWKQLPDSQRTEINRESAIALMVQHPTLIKRPITQYPKGYLVGFTVENYTQLL